MAFADIVLTDCQLLRIELSPELQIEIQQTCSEAIK